MGPDFVLNVLLYGLYFCLWLGTFIWFSYCAKANLWFLFALICISILYAAAQFDALAFNADNYVIFQLLFITGMLAVFLYYPEAEKQLKITGRTLMIFVLAMMIVNAINIRFPVILQYIANFVGPIDGHKLTGEFIRIQLENTLFVLCCLSLWYFSLKDIKRNKESPYAGRYAYKKTKVYFKGLVGAAR